MFIRLHIYVFFGKLERKGTTTKIKNCMFLLSYITVKLQNTENTLNIVYMPQKAKNMTHRPKKQMFKNQNIIHFFILRAFQKKKYKKTPFFMFCLFKNQKYFLLNCVLHIYLKLLQIVG